MEQRAHRGVLLHDNEDGTFSECGEYAPRRGGENLRSGNPQPAIVVSQGRPGSSGGSGRAAPPSKKSSLAAGNDDFAPASAASSAAEAQATSQNAGVSEQGLALWNYLQPHLIKHKGPTIPEKGYIKQLIELPRVRELDWHTSWLALHPFLDSMPRDVSALIIQVTGDPAPKPCKRCLDGRGPFTSCIMISPKAPENALRNIVSCANCFYHFGQTYCSHKEWGASRAEKIIRARLLSSSTRSNASEAAESPSSSFLENGEPDVDADDDEKMEDVDDLTPGAPLQPENAAGVPTGINEAEPGRPYNMWPGKRCCFVFVSVSSGRARQSRTNWPRRRRRQPHKIVRRIASGRVQTRYDDPRQTMGLPRANLPKGVW